MADTTRTFIAIPIDPETAPAAHEFLATRRRQLLSGSWARRVRWVAPERFHLTLRFLGQVPTDELPPLAGRLAQALEDISSFALVITRPCLFPRASRAKVIACPVTHRPELRQVLRRVETACQPLLAPEDNPTPPARPFRAHVTLGRIRRNAAGKAPNFPSFPGEIELPAEQVDIVASVPVEDGVRHEVRHRIRLRPDPPD